MSRRSDSRSPPLVGLSESAILGCYKILVVRTPGSYVPREGNPVDAKLPSNCTHRIESLRMEQVDCIPDHRLCRNLSIVNNLPRCLLDM